MHAFLIFNALIKFERKFKKFSKLQIEYLILLNRRIIITEFKR